MLATLFGKEAKEILKGWKSRNINDTRYITKYVVGLIKNHLQFAGEKARVFGIRGHITSRFRKEWLGEEYMGLGGEMPHKLPEPCRRCHRAGKSVQDGRGNRNGL